MKTYVLFFILWWVSLFVSFYTWKGSTSEEMLKVVLATQIAYILYRLTKEEEKQ